MVVQSSEGVGFTHKNVCVYAYKETPLCRLCALEFESVELIVFRGEALVVQVIRPPRARYRTTSGCHR